MMLLKPNSKSKSSGLGKETLTEESLLEEKSTNKSHHVCCYCRFPSLKFYSKSILWYFLLLYYLLVSFSVTPRYTILGTCFYLIYKVV